MRPKFIAGNWKMNTRSIDGELLAAAVVKGLGAETRVAVAVCPPFPFLARVAQAVKGTPVAVGAQNCYPKDDGAFTGEVSPAMLVDVGCQLVIVGHSERRQGRSRRPTPSSTRSCMPRSRRSSRSSCASAKRLTNARRT